VGRVHRRTEDNRPRGQWPAALRTVGAFEKAPPSNQAPYGLFNVRIRPYLRYPGEHIQFFFQFQNSGGFDLPKQAVFGPGNLYDANSANDPNPQAVDMLELFPQGKDIFTPGPRVPGGIVSLLCAGFPFYPVECGPVPCQGENLPEVPCPKGHVGFFQRGVLFLPPHGEEVCDE
jgi:hypothetical protein